MTFKIESGSKSIPGSAHPYEDRILVDEKKMLYAVADGVTLSSQGSGGVSAEIALGLLAGNFEGHLENAVKRVHEKVVEMRKRDGRIGESTLTCAFVKDGWGEVANIGDSPAYMVRDNELHSLIQEDKSELGYITQVIGYPERIEVHQVRKHLKEGDCLILASDGLAHVLKPSIVLPLVNRSLSAKKLVETLIEDAKARPVGYDDDKSLIILRVIEV